MNKKIVSSFVDAIRNQYVDDSGRQLSGYEEDIIHDYEGGIMPTLARQPKRPITRLPVLKSDKDISLVHECKTLQEQLFQYQHDANHAVRNALNVLQLAMLDEKYEHQVIESAYRLLREFDDKYKEGE